MTRRLLILVGLVAGTGLVLWRVIPPGPPSRTEAAPREREEEPPAFTGVHGCVLCHPREAEEWERSPHGRHAIRLAEPQGGADIGVGSVWMQAYMRRDERGFHRIVEECWDLREQRWRPVLDVLEEIRGRGDPDGAPPPQPLGERSFETDCAGCHASGTTLRLDVLTGRMDSDWRDLAIDCEACHGPGLAHAQGQDTEEPILRLQDLSPRGSTAVCGRCHGGPSTVGDLTPLEAEHFVGMLGDRPGVYPDGSSAGQVYQYASFIRSPCFTEGGLTCVSCHDAHGPDLRNPAHTDELCTPCHEEMASPAHTHHDPAGEGARCLECHMPRLLDGLTAHQREHRIGNPLPASPHVPDACTACHRDRDKAWCDEAYRRWWGDPPAETLEAIEAVALARRGEPDAMPLLRRALDHPDPFFRASAVHYLPDPEAGLRDPVPEVRLAALVTAQGALGIPEVLLPALEDSEPRVRAEAIIGLAAQDWSLGPSALEDLQKGVRLQANYVPARILLADLLTANGRHAEAADVLEVALAYRPVHARAWLALTAAYEAAGHLAEAEAAGARWVDLMALAVERGGAQAGDLEQVAAHYVNAGRLRMARILLEEASERLSSPAHRQRFRELLKRLRRRLRAGGS